MDEQNYIVNNHGVENMLKRIKPTDYVSFTYTLKEKLPDFHVVAEPNPKFVAPILSEVPDYSLSGLNDAQIILIEAVGATGKSELTKKMSSWLQCPIYDLGQTKVVAGNSLTGLLTKRMDLMDCFTYMKNIREGKSTIIIDALDEGFMKTNYHGYLDFLDDVLSLCPQKECPIILLGRYNAVELAASFFTDKNINFVTLKIEPFTLQQAEDFLFKAVENPAKTKFWSIFKETRDYILETIDGFFKDQASIKTNASARFIGYAPVLLSIATFLEENNNYQVVLDDLKSRNVKSVQLIVDIIERILKRDREEKVMPFIRQDLLAGRDRDFCELVENAVYTPDEQCARILFDVMHLPFPELDLNDPKFLSLYNERISTWINEHPFCGKNKIANIVFESYILARLSKISKYKNAAYKYMHENGVSYMFAYIYHALFNFNNLDSELLPFIYSSLSQLNSKQSYYSLTLESIPSESDEISTTCNILFEGSEDGMIEYKGDVTFINDDVVDLGARLEHLHVDVPLDFAIMHKSVEAVAPSYIKCRYLKIGAEEFTLYPNMDKESVMFECEKAIIIPNYNQFLQIDGVGHINNVLKVVSPERPTYPLYEYWTSGDVKLKDLSEEITSRYKKLRGIILEFRSHSKHVLAKYYERIDFVMGNNLVGKAVIEALIAKNIMYREGHLYKLDTDVMDVELGLSYDGIRNFERSEKVIRFLEAIK